MVNITRHRTAIGRDRYFPNGPVELLRTVRRLKPDVVHVHAGGVLSTRYAWLLLALRFIGVRRLLFTFHSGGFPQSVEAKNARPLSALGFALRACDAVIGVNDAISQALSRFGLRKNRVRTIEPTAVSASAMKQTDITLAPELEAFIAGANPLLITVGLLEPEYQLTLQLECLAAAVGPFPQLRHLVIGSGSLAEVLRRDVARLSLNGSVLLLGDTPREVVHALIKRSAALLRTTKYDGDAVSVREALAFGTPVVATRTALRPDGVILLDQLDAPELLNGIRAAIASSRSSATPRQEPQRAPAGSTGIDELLGLYCALK